MKRAAIASIVLFGLMPAVLVLAQSGSSSGYQGHDMGTVPATVAASSANYQLNGSVEAIVGASLASPNYQGGAGAPVPQASSTPVVPPPPSSGGSGGIAATNPSMKTPTLRHRVWTYLAVGFLTGERGESNATILVNGSEAGVQYPSAMAWQRPSYPLGLGNNLISVQAKQGSSYSNKAESVMRRRLVGDYTDSQYVDDFDLSLFSRAWGKSVPEADFNEDGKVDDLDLSLLASHWHQRF